MEKKTKSYFLFSFAILCVALSLFFDSLIPILLVLASFSSILGALYYDDYLRS